MGRGVLSQGATDDVRRVRPEASGPGRAVLCLVNLQSESRYSKSPDRERPAAIGKEGLHVATGQEEVRAG